MDIDKYYRGGKCCISGKPMSTSKHLNIVSILYKPEWPYPRMGNVLHPDLPEKAVALVHDECIGEKGKLIGEIKFAIELKEGEIIYHDVATLEKIHPPTDPSKN